MDNPLASGGMLTFGVVLWQAISCSTPSQAPSDAGGDAGAEDVPTQPDAALMSLALDFSATGCGKFVADVSRCDGTAPLTLAFTPIASAELTRFLWTFGDDTPDSSERSPTHTYALPGSYRVTLVGLAPAVGSLQQSHDAYVHVLPAGAGSWCDIDAQCADNLSCWCGSAMPCAPVLSRGLCSVACDSAAGGATVCPAGTTCADLAAGTDSPPSSSTPVPITPWRRSLCLPTCANDTACATGFRCRDLLAGPLRASWTRACFTSYPFEIGARCGDTQGARADADCASGLCADLGAFGRCSADCDAIACPAGTSCATFGDGRHLCLATCASRGGAADGGMGASPPCDDDPLLACEPGAAAGPLGFTVVGDPPSTRYCAPKRCVRNADCAPAGSCPVGGGNCSRLAATP
jgi:hypothetical protein